MGSNYMKKKYKNIIKSDSKLSTKDKIFAFYLDGENIELTDKEKSIKERWTAAFSLLCNYHSPQQAVNVLVKEFQISEAQAYRDVKNSMELFGNVTESDKQAYRHILFEFAMKVFQLAATAKNLPEMNKAIATMVKIKGLDREDPDIPDFSMIQNNQFNITLEDNQLKQLNKILGSGTINIDDLYE